MFVPQATPTPQTPLNSNIISEGKHMPNQSIGDGLEKLRKSVDVRAVQRAAIVGCVWPVGDTPDTLFPTAIYIATVSLLDEALEQIIDSQYPNSKRSKLFHRINVLADHAKLKDAACLHAIRDKRNSYAHDVSSFATWSEVEILLKSVDEEFKHLGIIT